jgi:Tfp pilus assembly protein PilO
MILERLTKRERVLVYATVAVVGAAIGYALIFEPLANLRRRLNAQVEEAALKLNKSLDLLRREKTVKEQFRKYAVYAKSLGTDEQAIAYLLKAIEEKATLSAVRISNIRPRPVKDKGSYKEFSFEVVAESDLEEIFKFVYELQNSQDILKVRKLTLTLKSPEQQVLKASMEISKISVK